MLAIVALLTLLTYLIYHEFIGKRRKLPPGPLPLPLIGNFYQFDPANLDGAFRKWHKEFGPVYTVWMGPRPNVVVAEYDLMKEVFAGKQADAVAGRPDSFVFQTYRGGSEAPAFLNCLDKVKERLGLVFADGPVWKEHRRFAIHMLRDFGMGKSSMEDRIRNQTEELVDNLDKLLEGMSSKVVDVCHPLELCIANVICSVIVSRTFGRGDERFITMRQELHEQVRCQGTICARLLGEAPWLRFLPLLGHVGFDKLMENQKVFYDFIRKEIEHRRQSFDVKNDAAEDFVTAYWKEMQKRKHEELKTENTTGQFSEEQLLVCVGDLWLAGQETAVTTLRWALLYMVYHPEIQDKVRAELENYLGSSRPLSMADRVHLPYMAATIAEIQRVTNLLPINLQHSALTDVDIGKYRIPKGTILLPQICAVLMDPKIFPDPEKLDPSRFLTVDGQFKNMEQMIPFSIGKRICLGESLARMELFLVFGTLIRYFRFSGPPDEPLPTLQPTVGFTKQPQPYKLLMQKLIE